jgi:hypothetical protein
VGASICVYEDQGAPDRTKKRLEAAAADLAASGKTDDPYLAAIVTGQKIHQVTGRALDPWEVAAYPLDWLEAVDVMAIKYPEMLRLQNGESRAN